MGQTVHILVGMFSSRHFNYALPNSVGDDLIQPGHRSYQLTVQKYIIYILTDIYSLSVFKKKIQRYKADGPRLRDSNFGLR